MRPSPTAFEIADIVAGQRGIAEPLAAQEFAGWVADVLAGPCCDVCGGEGRAVAEFTSWMQQMAWLEPEVVWLAEWDQWVQRVVQPVVVSLATWIQDVARLCPHCWGAGCFECQVAEAIAAAAAAPCACGPAVTCTYHRAAPPRQPWLDGPRCVHGATGWCGECREERR